MTFDPAALDDDARRALTGHLGQFVTEHKRALMEETLARRTRWLTIAVEDLHKPHNGSACLRTCECHGVQDVHIVETRNAYRVNPDVALGASKWLTLHRHSDIASCLAALRAAGYRVVATSPRRDGHCPAELPLDRPVAILFGNEEEGLSEAALDGADTTLRLPMHGFTESYNISVSVAIALSRLTERLHADPGPRWRLEPDARARLRLEWYLATVRNSELIAREFLHRSETAAP